MQVSADRTERDLIPAQHNLVAGYLKKTLSSGWSVSDSAHTHIHTEDFTTFTHPGYSSLWEK